MAKGKNPYGELVRGQHLKNSNKRCTYSPTLLCDFYSIYTIHKCGRELHNRTWWARICGPMVLEQRKAALDRSTHFSNAFNLDFRRD